MLCSLSVDSEIYKIAVWRNAKGKEQSRLVSVLRLPLRERVTAMELLKVGAGWRFNVATTCAPSRTSTSIWDKTRECPKWHHRSVTCTNKCEGHKDHPMANNCMGGSNACSAICGVNA